MVAELYKFYFHLYVESTYVLKLLTKWQVYTAQVTTYK